MLGTCPLVGQPLQFRFNLWIFLEFRNRVSASFSSSQACLVLPPVMNIDQTEDLLQLVAVSKLKPGKQYGKRSCVGHHDAPHDQT